MTGDRDFELKQMWSNLGYASKKVHLENFIKQLEGHSSYRDYYFNLNLESLINDSLFYKYFEGQNLIHFEIERRKQESLNRGWQPIENLDHEPQ